MSYLVIKCGGSMLDKLPQSFYKNIVTLADTYMLKPVIVHGGGPMISSLLTDLNIQTSFVDGMRVTTEEVLDVVEMVLSGSANKHIVRNIQANGGDAVGLSGVDGKLLEAEALHENSQLGYVGSIQSVQTGILTTLLDQGKIPVISPIAADSEGQRWNINADLTAAAVAGALDASLYMITDVSGVLKNDHVIPHIHPETVKKMVETGEIDGGMIPKVQAALGCLKRGIEQVVIVNGLEPGNLLKLADGEPVGTSFRINKQKHVTNLHS